MTITRTPAPTRFAAHTAAALLAAVALSISTASVALAGGGPPRPPDYDFEAAYINCVDDEVDEPGIDGDALVRVRLVSDSPEDVTVEGGEWAVTVDGAILGEGEFIAPAALPMGATYEQVVRIPGGTGPALFRANVEISNAGGSTTLVLDPVLEVPGDCEQPEEPGDETPPPTDDTPATTATPGAGQATPRFTG